MLKRAISTHNCVKVKLPLYISLMVRSHLLYCSSIWRPNLVRDSFALEQLRRRASKYILNYPKDMNYKSRLLNLKLLPITLFLEVQDILLFIRLIQDPPDNLPITDFVFLDSSTHSSSKGKIRSSLPPPKSAVSNHFYFNRIIRIWNSLPFLDLDSSYSSLKKQIYTIYWDYFISSYSLNNSCSWYHVCLCSNHST